MFSRKSVILQHRNPRSTESIGAVSESVDEDLNLSTTRHAQHLGLTYGTLWRILHLHFYKIQLT